MAILLIVSGGTTTPRLQAMSGKTAMPKMQAIFGKTAMPRLQAMSGKTAMPKMQAMSGKTAMSKLQVMSGETAMFKLQDTKQGVSLGEESRVTTDQQTATNHPTAREKLFPYIHTVTESVVETHNVGKNNYYRWASPVKSYLKKLENGDLQRVEAIDGQVVVEVFDTEKQLLRQRKIPYELPIFGGYYAGAEYQFLVFGQENDLEEYDKEIMRVVKYDKEWNRLGEASVCGANTTKPFEAGSLRMVEENGNLFIHTCHQMYTSGDGLRHQANMSYVFAEEAMVEKKSSYGVSNIGTGYVSHSFNQFLIAEEGILYRVDHGDAYPRAIVISKCNQSNTSDCKYEQVMSIQGDTGDNITKVSIGGFEKVGNHLIVAGNSSTQETEEAWNTDKKRNIFLTITKVDKVGNQSNQSQSEDGSQSENTKTLWLTDYSATDGITVKTPHLVKASENLLYVLWEEEKKETQSTSVKIVGVNAQGEAVTEEASIFGRLSDCKPIYDSNGTLTWYTSYDADKASDYDWDEYYNFLHVDKEETAFNFYEIDVSRLKDYQWQGAIDFSKVEFSLDKTEYVYQPEQETIPGITARYQGSYLEEGKDYKVSYENNEKPGYAKATITGMGCFQGKKELQFTIKPYDISGYTLIVTPAAISYDGQYHIPKCYITDGKEKVEIDGVYENNYQWLAGTHTVTFSAIVSHGYKGTLTATYEILPRDITQTNITFRDTDFYYTGQEVKAFLYVKDQGHWLYEGSDYTLTYENNIAVGTAQVTVTGIGNYRGSVTMPYTIQERNQQNPSPVPTRQSSDGTTTSPVIRPSITTRVTTSQTLEVASDSESIATSTREEKWDDDDTYTSVDTTTAIKTFYLKEKVKSIKKGKTYKLKAKNAKGKLTYKSNKKKIATVNKKGVVKAKKKGKAIITVTDMGSGIKRTCEIYVTNKVTQSQARDSILGLKKKYPEGKSWTNANTYYWTAMNTMGGGCYAFAAICSDQAFGKMAPVKTHKNFSKIKVGDHIRTTGHSVVVLYKNGNTLTVCEGNYNGSIHWGRKVTKAELECETFCVMTRY